MWILYLLFAQSNTFLTAVVCRCLHLHCPVVKQVNGVDVICNYVVLLGVRLLSDTAEITVNLLFHQMLMTTQ